jgi:HPt (histidine-containing phosphotransfer) domain-containing protein
LGASADAYASDSTGANAVAYLEQQEDFLQNLTQQLLADPNAPQFGGSKKPASSSTAVAKTYAAPVTKGLVRRQLERLDEFCAIEDHAGEEIARARVDYTQLRNRAQRLQQQLKVKEQLHEGVHLIDFEQLKIENTNLNEKIEERNEDLLKLRKKATTTIHILTHVKEKLEFIKSENGQLEKQSKSVEQTLTATRDRLGATKRDRDVFVHENARMKEKTPLIGADDLLMDYELRKKAIEQLRVDVVTLTNRHHELMLWIRENHGELSELQRRQMEL